MSPSPRIGIIGGMGNEAMVDLMQKIQHTTQHKRQHEPNFVAFGNSRLAYKPEEVGQCWQPNDQPERRKADTARYTLRLMQHLGVDTTGLACNSAHELFRTLLADIPLPFTDMLKKTAATLAGEKGKVLVMGVDSLVQSGLYQSALAEFGVDAIRPSATHQPQVMRAIYDPEFGIKTAKITEQAERLLCDVISEEHQAHGVQKVVLGCTELPLALTPESCERFKSNGWLPSEIEVIDASQILANALADTQASNHSDRSALTTPLNTFMGADTDWFPPLTFKVTDLANAISLQQAIFGHCTDFLAARGKSITGSYWHLPTLFFSASETDVEEKLHALGIVVHDKNEDLQAMMAKLLPAFYG